MQRKREGDNLREIEKERDWVCKNNHTVRSGTMYGKRQTWAERTGSVEIKQSAFVGPCRQVNIIKR